MRIGIDLGGTKIEGVVLDSDNRIVETKRIKTPTSLGYKAILSAVARLVELLEDKTSQRCTVGIGTPGALSSIDGTLKNSNTVCMNGQQVQLDIEQLLQRKVLFENDANCFALSEAIDGAARGRRVVFGVILGTGVGGGIVIDQRLHQGPNHIAGEWGHNVLVPEGRDCYCGKNGCVETYLSGPGLVVEWQEQSGRNEKTTAENIVEQARHGDAISQSTMSSYYSYFGQAMAKVINILDPDAVVLGGGMSNINDLYNKGVQQIGKHIFNEELKTPVLANRHGDSSGVRGAAQLWPADSTI